MVRERKRKPSTKKALCQRAQAACRATRAMESVTVENGPGIVSLALDECAYRQLLQIQFMEPGKPQLNCLNESSSVKFGDEYLFCRVATPAR